MTTSWHHRKRERLDGISDLLAFADGASVLDIGCNRGLIGYEFARYGAAIVHGCDNNAKAIAAANELFVDVACESKFVVLDLTSGQASVQVHFDRPYDIVLLIGVYHKLKRLMPQQRLHELMIYLAALAGKFFAWNGFDDEYRTIDELMEQRGLRCVSRSMLLQHVAIWKRT